MLQAIGIATEMRQIKELCNYLRKSTLVNCVRRKIMMIKTGTEENHEVEEEWRRKW
jgi:hypothetical protein